MNLAELVIKLYRLKGLKRSGWVRIGVKEPETVASHTFGAMLLAFLLGKRLKADVCKLLKLLLVHDLAEAEIGDIVWESKGRIDLKKREEKEKAELEFFRKAAEISPELEELFVEYLRQETREARLAREIEKLDMAVQALIYSKLGFDTEEFVESALRVIKTKELLEFLEEVKKCL